MHPDKPVIAAFDFDGTISTSDTFVPFLIYVFGWKRVALAIAKGLLQLILLRDSDASSRNRLKADVIKVLFTGHSYAVLELQAQRYAERVMPKLRPKALARIQWHRAQGHCLILVSASLEAYLEPIAHELGFNELLGTRLVARNRYLTGELYGLNCRGAEKVARLQELLGDLTHYTLYAYGDSAGDKEMLTEANYSGLNIFS